MYFKRFNKTVLSWLMAFVLVFACLAPVLAASGDMEELAKLAVVKQYENYYEEKVEVGSSWGNIEPYDTYILSKAGVKVDAWTRNDTSLKSELTNHLTDLNENNSTKHIAGGYLAASILGEEAKAEELLEIFKEMQEAGGEFGQSIYNDAPAVEYLGRAAVLENIDVTGAVYAISQAQFGSGAFDEWGDIGASCQAIRGLYYLNQLIGVEKPELKGEIKGAIDAGLDWLKGLQREDGSFVSGEWDDPNLNTVEVLITLKVLGQENSGEWQSFFNSGLDYILANSPDQNGKIGIGTVANYTAILDLAMALNHSYKVPETFIYLNFPYSEIIKGRSKQLEVNKFAGNNKAEINADITWTSNKPHIATVDESGLVTGIKAGIATISASVEGLTAQSTIKVITSSTGGITPADKEGTAYLTIKDDSGTPILQSVPYVWTNDVVSVLDILEKVLTGQGISYKVSAGYVSEINGLAEKKPGYPRSGWKFKVNGVIADKGAGAYVLKSGDRVEWYYSLDYTKDEDAPRFDLVEKEEEKVDEVKSPEIIAALINFLQEYEELDKGVIIKNADKVMDREMAIIRDEELRANLVDLVQVIDISKDNLISDAMEKIVILVPMGALDKEVSLSVREKKPEDMPNAYPMQIVAPIFDIGPDGLGFQKPVRIRIPLYLASNFIPEQLAPACYNEEAQIWEEIPGLIDLEEGYAIIERNHFSKYSLIEKPVKKGFADVNSDYNWAKEAIELLAGKGVILGTEIGFEPARDITRAEFAQLVYQMLIIPDILPAEFTEFTDVLPSDWFTPAVAYLYHTGIIRGYDDGSFRPEQSLSRNEAMLMIYKLSEVSGEDDNLIEVQDYQDIPEWARPAVNWAYSKNIIKGYADGTFRGASQLSRAECATVIFNWLKSGVI